MASFPTFQALKRVLLGDDEDKTAQMYKYLTEELSKSLISLQSGLQKLSFDDNFDTFESTVTIGAGATVNIRNQFRDGSIPRYRLLLRATGSSDILDGTWDRNNIQLKNNGAASATITVKFFK